MTQMRIEYSPLSEVRRWPKNPKKHAESDMDGSVARFGFNDPPTIDEGTGRLVEGHGRIEALQRAKKAGKKAPERILVRDDGEWMVPIVRGVSFSTEAEAEAYLLAHNRITELGGWETPDLAQMLERARPNLDGLGWGSKEIDKILNAANSVEIVEDEIPELPKVPITKPGDLWIFGEHRLLCGDSTKAADVDHLMDKQRAVLFATDPPYGVAYNDETGGKGDKIANDENDGPRLQEFLESVFRAAVQSALGPTAAWYIWHAQMTQGFFTAAAAAAAAAVKIHRQIIWVKPSLVLGHGDFHWQHELCFYGWREGARCPWYGDRKQTTVWNIGRENDHIHPTQKPVEIFARPMNYHTRKGEICYEPFSGSGSQVIAAQQLERKCFGMELSEKYCDVIIERWQNLTGLKAKRG